MTDKRTLWVLDDCIVSVEPYGKNCVRFVVQDELGDDHFTGPFDADDEAEFRSDLERGISPIGYWEDSEGHIMRPSIVIVKMKKNDETKEIEIRGTGHDLWSAIAEYDRARGTHYSEWDVVDLRSQI